jgi:putative membrane protein
MTEKRMEYFKDIAKGMVIGVANIIPGVSGGTMALVLGIYERLISSLHGISGQTVRAFAKLFTFSREGLNIFREELKRIDAWFLFRIGVGAVIAIVALAKIMTYLLECWHDPTYGFFFGLVLVSAAAPWKLMKRRGVAAVLLMILSAGLLVGLSGLSAGEQLIEKARVKQELALKGEGDGTGLSHETGLDPLKMGLMFFMGAVAISAMILPGISGSFLLLLMGGYFDILNAIASRDLPVLAFFSAGCLAGVLIFSRLLELLLRKWHDQTMAFLVGLVVGSLWLIWPFKTSATVGSEIVYLENTIPRSMGVNELLTIAAFLIGSLIVYALMRIERKEGTPSD